MTDINSVTPYNKEESKKKQVERMFDNIAFRYDFLNQFLSLGIHHRWRKKAVEKFGEKNRMKILDIATGTADFAIAAMKTLPEEVIGVDISEGMMAIGKDKIAKRKLENTIKLQKGDAESLQFPTDYFDIITVGFGVRNFENLDKGLQNIYRVLKPGGMLVVLEFSKPQGFFKFFHRFYFKYLTPFFGKLFSRDKSAYSYLPDSVNAFPSGKDFTSRLISIGFRDADCTPLTFGVASIYCAKK